MTLFLRNCEGVQHHPRVSSVDAHDKLAWISASTEDQVRGFMLQLTLADSRHSGVREASVGTMTVLHSIRRLDPQFPRRERAAERMTVREK